MWIWCLNLVFVKTFEMKQKTIHHQTGDLSKCPRHNLSVYFEYKIKTRKIYISFRKLILKKYLRRFNNKNKKFDLKKKKNDIQFKLSLSLYVCVWRAFNRQNNLLIVDIILEFWLEACVLLHIDTVHISISVYLNIISNAWNDYSHALLFCRFKSISPSLWTVKESIDNTFHAKYLIL